MGCCQGGGEMILAAVYTIVWYGVNLAISIVGLFMFDNNVFMKLTVFYR